MSNSHITSMPQPSAAAAHHLTEAETQTRFKPDSPVFSPDSLTDPEKALHTKSATTTAAGAYVPFNFASPNGNSDSTRRSFHSHRDNNGHPYRDVGRSVPPTSLTTDGRSVTEQSPIRTVSARLDPTLTEARKLRDQAHWRATWTRYSVNLTIALQVLLGAVGVTLDVIVHKREVGVLDAVLSGCSTIVASYLAAMRGSREPEHSLLREHILTSFIRKLEAFLLDHGAESGNDHKEDVENFRDEFDLLLDPPGSGGRMGNFHYNSERRKH